jgi:hypothetical protein
MKWLISIAFMLASSLGHAQECAKAKEKWHLLKGTVFEVKYRGTSLEGCFAAYIPTGESHYRFAIFRDGLPQETLPAAGSFEDSNVLSGDDAAKDVLAVTFSDVDGNGYRDVVVFGIASGQGGDSNFALVYWGCFGGFRFDEKESLNLMESVVNDREGRSKRRANISSVLQHLKRIRGGHCG